jgi:lysophospholipase L1-like esterase
MIRRITVAVATLVAVVVALVSGAAGAATASPLQQGDTSVTRYVALGDSYTAAPLVPQIIPANGCYQSTNNYPHLVAAALGVPDFVDASCSGAQTKDMFASQLAGVPPQLDAVTADTDLVTLSIGGNDFSVFGTIVGYCPTLRDLDPTGAPCRTAMRSGGDGDRLFQAVAVTQQRIMGVIEAIRARAPHARILVVGYPEVAPRVGTCPDLLPLADGDVKDANQVNQRLTLALRHAAAQEHADYVDVWHASAGHDICSTDPWINGQYTDYTRAQSYHPFANEQAAVAGLVVSELG